jgi:hypothetical protein
MLTAPPLKLPPVLLTERLPVGSERMPLLALRLMLPPLPPLAVAAKVPPSVIPPNPVRLMLPPAPEEPPLAVTVPVIESAFKEFVDCMLTEPPLLVPTPLTFREPLTVT